MASEGIALGFIAKQVLDEGIIDLDHINTIKNWLTGSDFPTLSDEQIILFLVSCDHDIKLTQETINVYYKIRSSSPELFTNRKVPGDGLQSALRAARICAWRDEEEYVYIYYGFKRDSRTWNLETTSKLVFMAIEATIYDYPPKGFHLIIDTYQLGLAIVSKFFHPVLLHVIFKYIQRAAPVKLTAIHVVNSSYLACKMLQMMSPFLDKKLVEQFVFYPKNQNLGELYRRLPKKALPSDLGGELPSIDVLQDRLVHKMEEMKTYYETEELHSRINKISL